MSTSKPDGGAPDRHDPSTRPAAMSCVTAMSAQADGTLLARLPERTREMVSEALQRYASLAAEGKDCWDEMAPLIAELLSKVRRSGGDRMDCLAAFAQQCCPNLTILVEVWLESERLASGSTWRPLEYVMTTPQTSGGVEKYEERLRILKEKLDPEKRARFRDYWMNVIIRKSAGGRRQGERIDHEKLRRLREEHEYSQQKFCQGTRVKVATLIRAERGRAISPKMVRAILNHCLKLKWIATPEELKKNY
jgi:DNA-binding XRE family transcriptional regulator